MKYINTLLICLIAFEGYVLNLKNRLYLNYLNSSIACMQKAYYREDDRVFKSGTDYNDGKDGFPVGKWTRGYCHDALDMSRAIYEWSHLEQIKAIIGYDKENNGISYVWGQIEHQRTMWDKK